MGNRGSISKKMNKEIFVSMKKDQSTQSYNEVMSTVVCEHIMIPDKHMNKIAPTLENDKLTNPVRMTIETNFEAQIDSNVSYVILTVLYEGRKDMA